MFLKTQKRTLSFLLALVLVLSTFLSVAVFPASAEGEANYGVRAVGQSAEKEVPYAALSAAIASIDADADGVADDGEWIITVLQDVLYDEHCTIPGNVTLLVPCDDEHTVNAIDSENSNYDVQTVYDYQTPDSFCTMEMAAGSTLSVADGGAICVNSKLASIGTVSDDSNNWNGAPTGDNGRIKMHSGSTITLNSGADLYVWGYIYAADAANGDEGKVEALSGSTVYEAFQIRNFRGLMESIAAVKSGAFPFNQYYVQNIEVPLYAYPGANEMGIAALHNTGTGIYVCPVSFIGEGGLFRLSADDAYLIKDYDEADDRLNVEIYGDSQLSSIFLSLYGVNLNSSSFPLPITNNIKVDIIEGNTEINQTITMLPGTELVVEDGASMTVSEGTAVYVYDADQWDSSYVGTESGSYVGVGYTASNGEKTDEYRNTPKDATIDINGEVVVYGAVYAAGYADISSSEGTGSIMFNTSAGATPETTYVECDAAGTAKPVNFGAISLKVADESTGEERYVSTDDGSGGLTHGKYVYANNASNTDGEFKVLLSSIVYFYDMDGEPLAETECQVGQSPVYTGKELTAFTGIVPEDKFSEVRNFIGWSTVPESNVAKYPIGTELPVCEGEELVEYYAAYDADEKSYTVQWLDLNNTVLESIDEPVLYSQIVAEDGMPALVPTLNPPSKVSFSSSFTNTSAGYSLSKNKALKKVTEFDGWTTPTFDGGVCTIPPKSKSENYYLVLFMNEDGTEAFGEAYAKNGSSINPCELFDSLDGAVTPTKANDGANAYTFSGWKSVSGTEYPLGGNTKLKVANPAGTAANANKQTFVPTFSQEQAYTITWKNESGSVLGTTTVTVGETPVPPEYTKPSTYGYYYTTTWPEIAPATEDTTYQATVTSHEKEYTVIWKKGDTEIQRTDSPVLFSQIHRDDCPLPANDVTEVGSFPDSSIGSQFTEFSGKVNRRVLSYTWVDPVYVYDEEAHEGTCTYDTTTHQYNYTLVLWLNGDEDEVYGYYYCPLSDSVNPKDPKNVQVSGDPAKSPDSGYYYTFNSTWKSVAGYTTGTQVKYSTTEEGAKKNIFIPQFDRHELVSKHSLSLNGDIDVNFYVQLPDGYSADSVTVDFSWGQEYIGPKNYDPNTANTLTGVTGTAATVDGVEYTLFSVPVAVKELNDTITVRYKSGDKVIAMENYKPTDYAYELLSKSDEVLTDYLSGTQTVEQLRELVRTMLINAANAQTYFNYNTGELATYKFEEKGLSTDLNDVTVPSEKIKYPAEDDFNDITFYGSALNLEDETGYTLYFNINDPAGYSVSKDDVSATISVKGETKDLDLSGEQAVSTYYGNKKLRISMKGLAAAEITNDISLTYKGKTITVNAGDYIDLALASNDASLVNIAKSVYNYNLAAIAFFGGN